MTFHDKECALAAYGALIERAKANQQLTELRRLRKEFRAILREPLEAQE